MTDQKSIFFPEHVAQEQAHLHNRQAAKRKPQRSEAQVFKYKPEKNSNKNK